MYSGGYYRRYQLDYRKYIGVIMKLPIDMQQNLLSIFGYIMEANGIGRYWREELTIDDRMEFIGQAVSFAVTMIKTEKKFTEAMKP